MTDGRVEAGAQSVKRDPKRTPGPWKVEPGGFVGGPVGFGRVCQTWNKFEEDFTNAEANARLIAAAPELLSAVREMIAAIELEGADGVRFYCARNAALEVIAKAEGISQRSRDAGTDQDREAQAKEAK